MLYLDYEWDLSPNGILLDSDLNVDQLGWKPGDYWKMIQYNGRNILVRVDKLEKFEASGDKHE